MRSLPLSSLSAILSSALFPLANTRQGFPLVSAVSDAHTACVGDGGALSPGIRRCPEPHAFRIPRYSGLALSLFTRSPRTSRPPYLLFVRRRLPSIGTCW